MKIELYVVTPLLRNLNSVFELKKREIYGIYLISLVGETQNLRCNKSTLAVDGGLIVHNHEVNHSKNPRRARSPFYENKE